MVVLLNTLSNPVRRMPSSACKKLVLVFPPLIMPTSPPLGPAMLKGFIERQLPQWRVTVLDLNAWCCNRLLKEAAEGGWPVDAKDFPLPADRPLLPSLAGFFRDPNLLTRSDWARQYDQYGNLFLRFLSAANTLLSRQANDWQPGQPLPSLFEEMLALIDEAAPDMVGMALLYTQQLEVAACLGRALRHRRNAKVFFGGSCFSLGASGFFKQAPEAADVVIEGDGEEPLVQLLRQEGNAEGIAGTSYLKDGALIRQAPVYNKDIDTFGLPDFSDLDLGLYHSPEPVIPLLLSRGCYWRRCAFCVHHLSAGLTYRPHSVDHAITVLRHLVSLGLTNFSFVDEMIAPAYFGRLAQAILDAGLDIAYYALAKPTRHFTPEILATMAKSGCKYLLWGVESGCQRILDLMDKGTRADDMAEVLHNAKAAGIANHLYIMCGFPTETLAEFTQTIRFLDTHKAAINAVHRGVFSLESGSVLVKEPHRFDLETTWLLQETAFGSRWGYRCRSGLSMEEAVTVFKSALPFFREFNPYARHLANFRDHALIVYNHLGTYPHPDPRQFPSIHYQ